MHSDTVIPSQGNGLGIRQRLKVSTTHRAYAKQNAAPLGTQLSELYMKGRLNAKAVGDIAASSNQSHDHLAASFASARGDNKLPSKVIQETRRGP